MRTDRLFWPLILVSLGVLLLLDNLKILQVSVWVVFVPLLMVLGGVSMLFGIINRSHKGEAIALSVPAEGGESARLKIEYGAGKLLIGGGAQAGQLLTGTFEGGVDHDARRGTSGLDIKLSGPSDITAVPWWGWDGTSRVWDMRLGSGIPLTLDVEVGAAESRIDLRDVRVTDLKLQTGASGTDLWMPASAGETRAKISGGVASIKINIPAEVAARIQWEGGLSTINVDTARFPRDGSTYKSANYDTATNKIDMRVEMGVGSVEIR